MEEGVMAKRREVDVLKQAERLGRESGLDQKLARYRERRRTYQETFRTPEKHTPGLPLQRPGAKDAPARDRRRAKGSVGDGLF